EAVDKRSPLKIASQPAILGTASAPANGDPRWAVDSPLNRIPTYSGTVVIPNRAKMDDEGRLSPGPNTKMVSNRAEAEAFGLDFLVADGLVSEDRSALLVRAFEELHELAFGASDVAAFWDKRGLWYADVLKH